MTPPSHNNRPHQRAPPSIPRNKRKPRIEYTEEQLQAALKEVVKNKHSLRSVAKKHGVPHQTLHDRLRRLHSAARDAYAARRLLDPHEEGVLRDWTEYLADTGQPLHERSMEKEVEAICGIRPTRKWCRSFLKRVQDDLRLGHPQGASKQAVPSHCIVSMMCVYTGLCPKRAQAFNRPSVQDYYKQLLEILEEYGIPWENIYNMDEKGVQRGGGRRMQQIKYFISRRRRPHYKLRSDNLELVTIIECISADGTALSPGFVFEGKEFSPEWWIDGDIGAGYVYSSCYITKA